MATETFFQNEILMDFIYPFLLVFLISFAILEKSKLFGDGKKQLNALVAMVLGLIFVGAFKPRIIIGNLVMFLGITVVVIFIILILWGFVFSKKEGWEMDKEKWMKITLGIIIGVIVLVGVLWATGLFDKFKSFSWTSSFLVNIPFIIIIAVIIAVILIPKAKNPQG